MSKYQKRSLSERDRKLEMRLERQDRISNATLVPRVANTVHSSMWHFPTAPLLVLARHFAEQTLGAVGNQSCAERIA